MIDWRDRRRVFEPATNGTWWASHAQLPTVDVVGDRWRVYLAVRDHSGQSRPTYVETPIGDPDTILRVHDRPSLDLGRPGAFDDRGVMPSWILHHDGRRFLYYTGWNVGDTVPYHTEIGLAVSDDEGETWRRVSEGPVLGRSSVDPFLTGSPCVLVDGGRFRCWYHAATGWSEIDGRWEPRYRIVSAESDDGVVWRPDGRAAIDYAHDDEAGIGRPSVHRDGDRYRMWFAYRSGRGYRTEARGSYRIGYAESDDGVEWHRDDDHGGLDTTSSGWDAEMVAYPHVVDHGEERFMFFNGNGFGRTGFGCVVGSRPPAAGAEHRDG